MESILNTIKKMLGLDPDYDVFDTEIITHINSVFSTLHQLGVGPKDGFIIVDESDEWDDFLVADGNITQSVKTYIYIKVRLLFDPPSTSFAQEALKKQADEYEWRLNVAVDKIQNESTMEVIVYDE